jgi:hypothetical protein
MHEGTLRARDGWERGASPGCAELIDTAVSAAKAHPYDAIVVFIGSIQLSDWKLPGWTDWDGLGNPELDARYVAAAGSALDRLTSLGVPVLMNDVPTPDWTPEAMGGTWPGSGRPTMNDAARAARLNQLTLVEVRRRASAEIVPYSAALAGPDGTIDSDLRYDGMHLRAEDMAQLMESGFDHVLASAYAAIVARAQPGTLRASLWP